jgi:hypothetical protein
MPTAAAASTEIVVTSNHVTLPHSASGILSHHSSHPHHLPQHQHPSLQDQNILVSSPTPSPSLKSDRSRDSIINQAASGGQQQFWRDLRLEQLR